ncbi:TIGR02450 family Trp-rich protein [Methylobacter sp. S3L5C]|uniref:TIGR02450 family Trp-rich protein n=1 Tax=Methylobacter sp. S3L5C TaxID=2839024 RepID=UPI001FAD4ED6|nr:TIGR02450 family Trp-rich protein [Methylobacter sp. S3L5C]UOA08883.1 TIGR02450 family Trp-rich protein [Methylobacter sp. S3L5C]
MNKMKSRQINPEKLLLSKWTAVQPANKEKHFLVTRLVRDEQEIVVACVLEAVINHREIELDWHLLKDASIWLPGWL